MSSASSSSASRPATVGMTIESSDPELIRARALERLAIAFDVPLDILLDRPRNPFYPANERAPWEADAMRADATHPIDREVTL